GWGKQHGTMRKAKASRGCSYHRRILAEPHRLQPDPHPEIGCRIGELRKETRKSLLCRAKRLNHQHKAPYRNGESSNFPVFPQTVSGEVGLLRLKKILKRVHRGFSSERWIAFELRRTW